MTTATAPTITETRYAKLKAKLRELFELDKSDLDFGIYRIMAAKNQEVTDFLDRQLKDKVRATLAEHGSGELDKIKTELNETIANLRDNAVPEEQIETNTKVVGLRKRLEAAGGKTGEELEADIYNHLLAFFSRYYDEGDFISQRRYKGDTYAIPYSGEEVTLHWANKDQYYIKSGEWHKDYRFKLPNGKRVQFALVNATQETGNNKEADESKRRFILVEDNPVSVEGDTLTLRFHFKAPNEAEKDRANEVDLESVWGGEGKTEARSNTDSGERERFCADAEDRASSFIPIEWAEHLNKVVPLGADNPTATVKKPERTLLGKELNSFTAKNTFDYFIHKDLGGFLSRELDFYIKNEVVRLDDLDKAPTDHLQRIQGRVKAIRAVASSIIDLLASIENFQKKLWLKKKFVLNTSWLITIDRIPDSLRDVVAENQAQWDEWEKLGFKPKDEEIDGLFEGAKWGTRAYLDACDKLVVDTRLFDEVFAADVLAAENILAGSGDLHSSTTSLLLNGDNFHALKLLRELYRSDIQIIKIDPPYNTDTSGFLYKNSYRHSSWMSFMLDRAIEASYLLAADGVYQCHIDENEYERLHLLLDSTTMPGLGTLVWDKRNPMNSGQGLANQHEYVVLRSKAKQPVLAPSSGVDDILDKAQELLGKYGCANDELRKEFSAWVSSNSKLSGGEKAYRYIDDEGNVYQSVSLRAPEPRKNPKFHTPLIHPVTGKPCSMPPNGFSRTPETLEGMLNEGLILFGSDESSQPRQKSILKRGNRRQLSSLISDGSKGKSSLDRLGFDFPYCHPVSVYSDLIQSFELLESSVVLDYFAGSGTTGEAVVSCNREGCGISKAILVEVGLQFEKTLRPRMLKMYYSDTWKDGQAQSHDQGLSALVKCFAVESYEDALNNLPAPTGGMFDGQSPEQQDALIKYALDLEMGPDLLDLDIFRDPWGHTINAQLAGDDEIKRHKVDLVETFNYLLGLRVSAYGPIERYNAEFERSEHKDDLGRLKLKGRLRRDPDGPFKFHRVEGILNDESNTRVLVVWRTLTDDPEKDSAVLDAWMARHRQETTERTEHRDYHQIYINGCVTLPQPTQEIQTVYRIEDTFKQKMFEDTDGVS